MKTIKSSRAIWIGILAMLMSVVMIFALAACDNTNDNKGDDGLSDGIYKVDATLDASITMGAAGPQSFAGVYKAAYITKESDEHTLTIIFQAGPLTVMGITGTIFVDDNPINKKVDTDGTIGWYKKDGTLVTDGITVTYSSGDNYAATPNKTNVYYVQSVSFKVDELRDSYDLTLFFNSNMMGMQFAKDSYPATLKLDLDSAESVTAIEGLGVETLGTVPQPEPEYTEHQVPILSLTSAAPLPQVQAAFAEAFGDNATLVVYKDGSKKLRLENKHMIINLGKNLDANVTYVEGANVISTRESVYSDATTGEPVNITVPDIIELDYSDDCNGVLELTIGVDFMASMTKKEDIIKGYSTKVTLTLDLSGLEL